MAKPVTIQSPAGEVRCLSRREAAELLSVSERTLYERTQPRGTLKAFRMGRRVLYSVAELERYIAANSGSTETGGEQ